MTFLKYFGSNVVNSTFRVTMGPGSDWLLDFATRRRAVFRETDAGEGIPHHD